MNIVEFVNLVRKMRTAQRTYFRTRQKLYLELSKQLEKEVDKMLVDGVILQVPTTTATPEEERQLRLHLEDERDVGSDGAAISELDVELGFPPGSVERFIKANPPSIETKCAGKEDKISDRNGRTII